MNMNLAAKYRLTLVLVTVGRMEACCPVLLLIFSLKLDVSVVESW